MTVRLTMKEERELTLAIAMLSFSAMLQGRRENPLISKGYGLIANIMLDRLFGKSFSDMTREHYPNPDEIGAAMKAMIEATFPEAKS